MKVLLDEPVPRRLAASFPDAFEAITVQEMGWAGCENGELLSLAATHGFDALVTVDQGFAYQQNVADLPVSVVIMIARRTRLQELRPLVPQVIAVLSGPTRNRIHLVRS